MFFTNRYNSLVPEHKKIMFGINKSLEGPVIEASIPGYTRLSVHCGGNILGTQNCARWARNCNNLVAEHFSKRNMKQENIEKFSIEKAQNDNDVLNLLYRRHGYNLPKFDIINTGIMHSRTTDQELIYQKQIKGTKAEGPMPYRKVEIFANFMYPDLNDREMYYLAEKAEFGKGDLLQLKIILEDRLKRYNVAKENKNDLRQQFIMDELNKAKDAKQKTKIANELYIRYMETSEISPDVNIKNFKSIMEKAGLDNSISDQVVINNIDKNSFEDLLELDIDIPQDLFVKKFREQEDMDLLFKDDELDETYFNIIFNKLDIKNKAIFILKVVESQNANSYKPTNEDEIQLFEKQEKEKTERLQELVVDQIIEDEDLKPFEDEFFNLVDYATKLVKIVNSNSDNKEEQEKIVNEIFEIYQTCLQGNSSKNDMEDFIDILNSLYVDEDILENFKKSNIYYQMIESVKTQGATKRNREEKYENNLINGIEKVV